MKLPILFIFFACTLVGCVLGGPEPKPFPVPAPQQSNASIAASGPIHGERIKRSHRHGDGEVRSRETYGLTVDLHLFVEPHVHGCPWLTTTYSDGVPWTYVGVLGQVFPTPQDNTVPLIRYYSPVLDRFHYGTSKLPNFGLGDVAYSFYGIVGYVYPVPRAWVIPLYQWYNKQTKNHHITPTYEHRSAHYNRSYDYPVFAYIFP